MKIGLILISSIAIQTLLKTLKLKGWIEKPSNKASLNKKFLILKRKMFNIGLLGL